MLKIVNRIWMLGLGLLCAPLPGLEFDFTPTPGMDQEAIDGFEEAGELWNDLLADDVVVNIEIDFRELDPNVLGSTRSERVVVTYEELLDALDDDRLSEDDASAVAALQPAPDLAMLLNRTRNSPLGSGSANVFLDDDGDDNNTTIRITRANAKALGLVPGDDPALDASIAFNSRINWDFDPGDGTRPNHFNFIVVAAHEIGHMLGFTSGVDILDGNSPPVNGPFSDHRFTFVSPADLFRYSPGSLQRGEGVIDWTADARDKIFSADGGATDPGAFSTGRNFGDGRQASHWKDDRGLGIMDPTVAPGESPAITGLDLRLFDVVGWNLPSVAPEAEADLAITVTPTVEVSYVVAASNAGPDDVSGAVVDKLFPVTVTGVAWECAATGGARCTASGSGDIHDTVDLPAGGEVTYTATGTAASPGGGSATVTAPGGVRDTDPGNNSDEDG